MSSRIQWWNWWGTKICRNASTTTDTKITSSVGHHGPAWERCIQTSDTKTAARGREDASQRSRTGRARKDDNTGQPTSEQKQNGTERGKSTKQLRSASKAHPRHDPAMRSLLSWQSDSCFCSSTSERRGKGCEYMTGREDGWEEEAQKESPD